MKKRLTETRAGHQWEKIGDKHHHGIAIPLFALHSKESAGIGEYSDLIPLIDWLVLLGFDFLQLLPLNDSGLDKSPYNNLSAFALNPLHISLAHLPGVLREDPLLKELQALTSIRPIPYVEIRKKKNAFLRRYFEKEAKSPLYRSELKKREMSSPASPSAKPAPSPIGPPMGCFADSPSGAPASTFPVSSVHFGIESSGYQQFVQENAWVQDYALFRALKEKNQHAHFHTWPEDEKNLSSEQREHLCSHFEDEIRFWIFLQYLCHSQLAEVKAYADAKKVLLMGDVPILLSGDSADVWCYPRYFDLHCSAGAPPDVFSEEGQNWGFPLYNWQEMEKDEYAWWKHRLLSCSHYYHLMRIDHVVGFFRIWAVPEGKSAREGHFVPPNGEEWIPQGKRIMEMMLDASPLLPIGEDLGVVPPVVRTCLRSLGICGTKVMRWERMWNEDSRFIPVHLYEEESLTTVSTHDSETLVLWWKNQEKEVKTFCEFKKWVYKSEIPHEYLYTILYDAHHSGSLFHVNLLQEYLSLFKELVDEDPMKERVNIPGILNDTNWGYRFKPSIEELVQHQALAETMRHLIC